MKYISRISKRDRLILEDLESRYTPDDIADAIASIKDNNVEEPTPTTPIPVVKPETSIQEAVLNYIMKLEGYRIRLREIHWQTSRKSEHLLSDDIMSDLTSLEDKVAEDCMGLLGIRIKIGDVKPIFPEEVTLKALLCTLAEDTCTLRASIEDNPQCAGLVSILDDCIHDINVGKYLDTLS